MEEIHEGLWRQGGTCTKLCLGLKFVILECGIQNFASIFG